MNNRKLEAHTFGGSRAAEVLVDMLNQNKDNKAARHVCSLWTRYSQGMREIDRNIKGKHFRDKFMDLWFKHCEEQIGKSELTDKCKSFLINLEKTLVRKIT